MLLRSSGTTGIPKTMLISRGAMQVRIRQRQRILRLEKSSGYLVTMPLNVAGIFYAVTACIRLGATVVQPSGPPSWRDLADARVTHATVLPVHLRRLLAAMPETATSRLELTLCVIGARLPSSLREEALDRLCGTIQSVYSSNEAGSICTIRPDSAGDIVPGIAVQIVDQTGCAVPTGAVGRVRVQGPGTARGYWGRDGGEPAAFEAGWFSTGDLGRIDVDGRLVLLGRCDDVVNLGGIKRSCEDVEDAIIRRLKLRDVGVFTVEEPRVGQVLVVCAVVSAPVHAATVINTCVAMSGGPVSLYVLDALPRTEHGKLQRRRLREMLQDVGSEPPGI